MIRDSQQLFSLAGQVAIVTNATTTIGVAAVRELSRSGAIVCGMRNNIFTLQKAVSPNLSERNSFDKLQSLDRLVDEVNRKYGRLNTLVNIGEITMTPTAKDASIKDVDIKAIDRFRYRVETQLDNSLDAMRQVLPYLKQSDGSIINIIAIDNALGFPDDFSYIATKNALLKTTKHLATDLTAERVRINNIVVGYRQPSATAAHKIEPISDRLRQNSIETTISLASNNANLVTGQDIFIREDCTLSSILYE